MHSEQKSYTRFGLLILFLVIVVLISSNIAKGPFANLKIPTIKTQSTFTFEFGSSNLKNIISSDLKDQPGDYSVYIEDLSDGEKYGLRSTEAFPAASLYKVYLIAAVLKEVYGGQSRDPIPEGSQGIGSLKLDSKITASKDHLISVFGDTDFGYEDSPETISYTVDEALTRVGRISDNFAAIMLAEKIGWDKVSSMADLMGATNTTIKSPISTSTGDIGRFFKLLYQKKVVSAEVSDGVNKYLSLNQINDRIPAGVPDEVEVVHKTGELSRVRNDAGIVYLNNRDPNPQNGGSTPNTESKGVEPLQKAYVIVMMSQNLQYEDDAIDLEAKISKDVYDYISSKK